MNSTRLTGEIRPAPTSKIFSYRASPLRPWHLLVLSMRPEKTDSVGGRKSNGDFLAVYNGLEKSRLLAVQSLFGHVARLCGHKVSAHFGLDQTESASHLVAPSRRRAPWRRRRRSSRDRGRRRTPAIEVPPGLVGLRVGCVHNPHGNASIGCEDFCDCVTL